MSEAETIGAMAEKLARAHRGQLVLALEDFPEPTSVADAYEVADATSALIGSTAIGWKVGATKSSVAREFGLDGPFAGRILQDCVYNSGDEFILREGVALMLEAEYVVELDRDLPKRAGRYTRADIESAVRTVRIGLEINLPHVSDIWKAGGRRIIADNGGCIGIVLGPNIAEPTMAALTESLVFICVDGEEQTRGTGAEVLGHPYEAIAWLANHCIDRALMLSAGEIISTGSCGRPAIARKGQSAFAEFGSLGRVLLSL